MVKISIVILSILTVVYFALSLSILITSVSLDKQIKDIKNVNIDIWIENCSLPLDYNQTIGHYDYNISSVNTTEKANITGIGIFRESYYYTTISWGSSNTSIYRYLNYTNGTLIIDENAELDFGAILVYLSYLYFGVVVSLIILLAIILCKNEDTMPIESSI